MTSRSREQKMEQELQTIKTYAEWCEKEHHKIGTKVGHEAAAHFALIAMGAEAVLTETQEEREAEKTGTLPAYCI